MQITNCKSTQKNGLNLQKFKGTWYNSDQASCIHAEAMAPNRSLLFDSDI